MADSPCQAKYDSTYGLINNFETTHHKQLMRDVKHAIYSGNPVVLSGVIGDGKTAAMAQLRDTPEKEDRVAVSTSVSIEKNRVAIGTLVTALFWDLSSDKNATIPKSGELRDRATQSRVQAEEAGCPVRRRCT